MKMDQLLGEILGKIDSDTTVLIFSDHGFTDFDYEVDLNRWLADHGYLALAGLPALENEWGALFGLVDWSKTRAYALGFSSIYINKRGREGKGIVGEDEVAALKAQLVSELSDLSWNGSKIVHKVYREEDVYNTGAYFAAGPDLIVGLKPGYRFGRHVAIGGVGDEVVSPNEKRWRGDHIVDPSFVPGVFFSSKKIDRAKLSVYDIAGIVNGLFDSR
jgi:predicted AlkP superfamily phosphohydrolase/phosphomutase